MNIALNDVRRLAIACLGLASGSLAAFLIV